MASAIEQTKLSNPQTVTNAARPEDQVRHENDLFHKNDNSQHDRNTDTMGEWNKVHEQEYNQGSSLTGKHNTGTTNAPSK